MSINKNAELLPYYQKAKEFLNYDPETGIFTWKVYRSHSAIIGKVAGYLNNQGYELIGITVNKKRRDIQSHRLAWFIVYDNFPNITDHINGIRNDNRIDNLRSCTNVQNGRNVKKYSSNTSGYKGVSWDKSSEKWRARIGVNNERINLGFFDCPKEASDVYESEAKKLFKEFYKDTRNDK